MRNAGWSMVVLCLIGGVAMAQQPARPGVQPVRPGQPAGAPNVAGQQQHHGDQEIAQLIVGGNRHEIEIAKFAMNRLQSDEAKEVATKMIKDHTEAMNKFAKFAGQQPASTGTRTEGRDRDGDREGRRDEGERASSPREGAASGNTAAPGARTNDAPGGTAGVANPNARNAPGATTAQGQGAGQPHAALKPVAGGGLNWAAVHQEICDAAIEDCKKELSRYEGNEFDKAYLGSQVAAHGMMLTKLKVLKKHASSQLASEIDDAIETTQAHLKHVRSVMDDKKEEKSDSKKS
jgi:predicted outer membrane protein